MKNCHILPNFDFFQKKKKKKKGKDMAKTQRKDNGLVREIQNILLEDEDFLRRIVQENLQKILESEFEDYIQAGRYERTEHRKGYRNGIYRRTLKTRVGVIELEVVRDREGNFKTELFRRYQRNEKALVLSLVEMYLQGVSTRKVKRIVEHLCGTEISKSTISNLSKELDENINKWRNRPLDKSYPYLVIDARYENIREAEAGVIGKAVFVIIGIDAQGYREILSVEIGDSEREDTWSEIFRKLKERGLKGLSYVVSDDHKGLVKAVKREFQGIRWQRCQVHFIRNFMDKIGKKNSKEYLEMLRDVFNAPEIKSARERKEGLVKKLEDKKPSVADWLDREIEFCFTVYSLPIEHRKKMKSTNMIERLNEEIKRRSRVVRIFPNDESCIRLIGAICMEKSEEWQSGRRYLNMSIENEVEGKKEPDCVRSCRGRDVKTEVYEMANAV